MTNNERAFLDMIAKSEGTYGNGDNGYNVMVGNTLFVGYDTHPHKLIHLTPTLASTAAGRYQLLAKYYDVYAKMLGLTDFSPASQDAIALQQIKECRALDDINAGNFEQAIYKVRHIWASLPGAGYGQHENKMATLKQDYIDAGGSVA